MPFPSSTSLRRGSSLVYVLFIVLVLGISVVSLLNNIGNEILTNITRNNRVKMLHTTEAASEIARGRLRLKSNRREWESSLFNSYGPLLDTTINGMTVKAELLNGATAYDNESNPFAILQVQLTSDGRTVTLSKTIKEANASDFSEWYGPSWTPFMEDPITGDWCISDSVHHATGRVFYTGGAGYNMVFGGPYPAGTGPYFEKEVIVLDSPIKTDSVTVPVGSAFQDGVRTVTSGSSEAPQMDSNPQSVVEERIAEGAAAFVISGVAWDSKVQIRLKNNGTFDYRVVTSASGGQYADPATYPFTTNVSLPTGDNAIIKIEDSGSTWAAQNPILVPRTNVTTGLDDLNGDSVTQITPIPEQATYANLVPYGYTDTAGGGVQIWVDNSGQWSPYNERTATAPQNLDTSSANTQFCGRLTIASSGNIEIVGRIEYANSAAGGDMLALIAKNSIYLRNDGFAAGGYVASTRISRVDAFMIVQRGSVLPVWFWDTSTLPANAPALTMLGSVLYRTSGAITPSFYTAIRSGPQTWRRKSSGWFGAILPGFTSVTHNYDERGVTETPLGFPKVWNLNPLVMPETWDVKYE